jgi:CBS domain-containing protein
MKLSDLLNARDTKYRAVVAMRPSETIMAVVHELAKHDKGSIMICDDEGKLVGIITERDIVRKCLTSGKDLDKTKIQDVMTTRVVVAKSEDDPSYAINAMKEANIRHIPIVDAQKKAIGMISMRDLLGVQLEESSFTVHILNEYISGYY